MARPDGRLTFELFPEEKGPQDECGVFGVWAPGEEAARLTYFGLYALQHRGQQSAGIAAADGKTILVYKDMGLVSQVFDDQTLASMPGHIAIGHVRYSTTGASIWENAQPTLGETSAGTLALAHNGNLTNTAALAEIFNRHRTKASGELKRGASTDTAVITALMGVAEELDDQDRQQATTPHPPATLLTPEDCSRHCELSGGGSVPAHAPMVAPALRVLPLCVGAYSLVFMDDANLYAARDPHGIRPLVLGRLHDGWCVASETAALDIVGATFEREVEPGELLVINENGVCSYRMAPATPHGCIFEYVYLARPDTKISGKSIIEARNQMGAALAREHPVEADIVIPTPDSGTPAAVGYAQASGIPFAQGLVKNAYVGRTFIQPTQTIRQLGIRLKLNPLKEVIAGKRLVVIDDSIVRGNTQRALVKMLRDAGAKEVHVRISSPPVMWPCFFGIDFPTREELIASSLSEAEICESIGADSLGYLSIPGMLEATGQPQSSLCTACFTGNYPLPIPKGTPIPGTPGAVTPVSTPGAEMVEATETVGSGPAEANASKTESNPTT